MGGPEGVLGASHAGASGAIRLCLCAGNHQGPVHLRNAGRFCGAGWIYAGLCLCAVAGIQNDLIFDYQSNVRLYPEFQAYFREHQPKLLAVWGKNDPSFIPAGAEAFKRDLPDAIVKYVDSGHFALESHHTEIAGYIKEFLNL